MALKTSGDFPDTTYSEFVIAGQTDGTAYNGRYSPPDGYTGPNILAASNISAAGAGPNGGRYWQSDVDDRAVDVKEDGSGTQHQRVHMISLTGGVPAAGTDGTVWAGCRSVWLSSGYTADNEPVIADEYHVDNSGVAPFLLQWWRDSASGKPRFHFSIQGGLQSGGSPYSHQTVFGPGYPGQIFDFSPGNISFRGATGSSGYVPPWQYNQYAHLRWEVKWGVTGNGSFQADYYDYTAGSATTVATQGVLSGTGTGTFTLTSATGFVTGQPITVFIGSELITGTLSGTTFTITKRGTDDSVAVSHSAGAAVTGGAWVNVVPTTTLYVGYGPTRPNPGIYLSYYRACASGRYTNPAPSSGGTRPSAGVGLGNARYAAGALAGSTVAGTAYTELKTFQNARLGPSVGGVGSGGGGGGGGADPTVGPYGEAILDSLVGADTDPIAGAYVTNYTGAGHSNWKRLSNALAPTNSAPGVAAQAYHNAATYGPNVSMFYKIDTQVATVGQYWDTVCRLTSVGGAFNAIELAFTRNADGTYLVQVVKHEAGASSTIGTVFSSFAVADGTTIGVACTGTTTTTVEVWTWSGAAWVLQGSFAFSPAAALQTAGYVGFEATQNSAVRIKAWGVGTIAAVPANTVAPTITAATLTVGDVVTLGMGTWPTATSYDYQVQSSTDAGVTWSAVLAGSGSTTGAPVPFTLTTNLTDSLLRVAVVGRNGAGGGTSAASNSVGPVVAPSSTVVVGTTLTTGAYDVVIDGKGYMLLDALESSIPFRTHRAIYGQTQPFVERQNVSNSYGDNAQDFFLTIRERDWSLGEQQKFFRAGQDGRYWMGSNVEVSTPGQVTLTKQTPSLSFAATAIGGCPDDYLGDRSSVVVGTSTTLYRVQVDGTITSLGAHGLGAAPGKYAFVNDAAATYISTTTAGTVGVRKWSGAAYSTFSASGADSLAFLNNSLYGWRSSNADLVRWDSGGTLTSLFGWKTTDGGATGGATNLNPPILRAYGGKLLIIFQYAQESSELWIYDGNGTYRLAVFPNNFTATSMIILYGTVYIGGNFYRSTSTTTMNARPGVLFYDGSSLGILWRANDYGTTSIASNAFFAGPGPALGVSDGRVIFTDDTTAAILAYNPALGGVSTIGSYTAGGTDAQMISTGSMLLMTRTQTTGYYLPSSTTTNTSGYVTSSLVDFDSSLSKQFRGVKVEFDLGTDGDGGSVDISYQLDSLSGSFTTLRSAALSGTEYTFANVSGHAIAVRVTLNKGTSTAGPTLRSLSIRGAPVMPIYPRGEYIIDCTASVEQPRELRDGSLHPLSGFDQAQNLVAARNSLTPIQITDKMNGTFTGFVDVNDPQGFDIYEIRSGISVAQPSKSGSYVVRLTVKGV